MLSPFGKALDELLRCCTAMWAETVIALPWSRFKRRAEDGGGRGEDCGPQIFVVKARQASKAHRSVRTQRQSV